MTVDAAEVRVDRLCEAADKRAGTAPVTDIHERDFLREAQEELEDARNYLVWHQRATGRDESVQEALGLVAAAYETLIAPQAFRHHSSRSAPEILGGTW